MINAKRGLARRSAALVMISAMLITTSAGVALPPIAVAADLLAALAARSPGAREAGVLTNKKALAHSPVPAIGGLDSPRWTPPVDAAMPPAEPLAGGAPAGSPESALGEAGPADHFGSDHSFAPGFGFPGDSGFFGGGPGGLIPVSNGGGGGNPGGGGGGGVPPPPPPPPTTPVPEPGSWILLLASFALLGAHLRRMRPAPARCA